MGNIGIVFERFPELETENLNLREIIGGDAKGIFEMFSDEEMLKYQGLPPMQSPEDADDYVMWTKESYNKKSFVRWAIEEKTTNKFIGLIGMYYFNEKELKAEVSYNLNKNYWGRGLMKEALSAIRFYMFNTINLKRIEAEIDPNNLTSIKLAEKLGFEKGELNENRVLYIVSKDNYV